MPQGDSDKNKRQGTRKKVKEAKEKAQGQLSLRAMVLDRIETDVVHRQTVVYTGEREQTLFRMRCLILIGNVNLVRQMWLLIVGLQYFDSWALVDNLRIKKLAEQGNRPGDLGS